MENDAKLDRAEDQMAALEQHVVGDGEGPERWLPVFGYEGWYEVSDHGRIKRIMAGNGAVVGSIIGIRYKNDYHRAWLCRPSGRCVRFVHRLVAAAFLGPCPVGYEVNHIDGNKTNNRLSNLEYVTPSKNTLHAIHLGLMARGEGRTQAKLRERDVLEIRELGRCGISPYKIARKFGMCRSSIKRIIRGEYWNHVG